MRLSQIKPKEIVDISARAVLIRSYDGRECVFPKSQLFRGLGHYWVSTWLAEKKEIQCSRTKKAFLRYGKVTTDEVITHIPKKVNPIKINIDKTLLR